MKEKEKVKVDDFFVPSKALTLKLLDYIIEHPLEKLPTSKELSEIHNMSDITVKKVMGALSGRGYLKSNKKGGTKIINRFSLRQREVYSEAKEDVKEIIKRLEDNGFDLQEILTCFYNALLEYAFDSSGLLYTERDHEMVFMGASELSDILSVKVKPVYIENVYREMLLGSSAPKAVIVPFYCYSDLEHLRNSVKIFPLRTTHPLEFLSTTKEIAYNSVVVYVAASSEEKEGVFGIKKKIENNTFKLLVYKIDELIDNPHLLKDVDMVVAYKWIVRNNEHVFKNVPRVVAYNRFDDKEGIKMIEGFISSNKTGG